MVNKHEKISSYRGHHHVENMAKERGRAIEGEHTLFMLNKHEKISSDRDHNQVENISRERGGGRKHTFFMVHESMESHGYIKK